MPKLSICLNRITQVKAIINTSTEINIMTQGLTNNRGLAVTGNPHLILVFYNREYYSFKGLCENI
jgi:hypothetical protein